MGSTPLSLSTGFPPVFASGSSSDVIHLGRCGAPVQVRPAGFMRQVGFLAYCSFGLVLFWLSVLLA